MKTWTPSLGVLPLGPSRTLTASTRSRPSKAQVLPWSAPRNILPRLRTDSRGKGPSRRPRTRPSFPASREPSSGSAGQRPERLVQLAVDCDAGVLRSILPILHALVLLDHVLHEKRIGRSRTDLPSELLLRGRDARAGRMTVLGPNLERELPFLAGVADQDAGRRQHDPVRQFPVAQAPPQRPHPTSDLDGLKHIGIQRHRRQWLIGNRRWRVLLDVQHQRTFQRVLSRDQLDGDGILAYRAGSPGDGPVGREANPVRERAPRERPRTGLFGMQRFSWAL